jgi:nucleotide-binding universal stress UspA family protein
MVGTQVAPYINVSVWKENVRTDMRMKRILIAYDGLSLIDEVVEDLGRAGLSDQAEALVVSIADVVMPALLPSSIGSFEAAYAERLPEVAVMARERAFRAVEDARGAAAEASDLVRAKFPAWRIRAESSGGSPAWELIRMAKEWRADLIVVGPPGRPGRFTLGSVSKMVVAESDCSVRIVRGAAREDNPPPRIIIGVDGSPEAEVALSSVARRAWLPETEVRVVSVLEPGTNRISQRARESDQDGWLKRAAEAALEKLRVADITASSIIREGDPKLVLRDEAEQWSASCIFVGARGLSRGERFLVGSVSSALAARARCSVEIVRAARSHQRA